MVVQFIRRNRVVILYGLALALLTFLLKWLELRFLIFENAIGIYVGLIALFFTTLGIWLALKLTKPKVKTLVVEKEVYITPGDPFKINEFELNRTGLSKRELEVLELMAQGFSNQEIADKLFVSLNTVKSHTARVFEKLEVKRRTQAIEKAKRLVLIP